jgi:hypothetical protein
MSAARKAAPQIAGRSALRRRTNRRTPHLPGRSRGVPTGRVQRSLPPPAPLDCKGAAYAASGTARARLDMPREARAAPQTRTYVLIRGLGAPWDIGGLEAVTRPRV